MFLYNTERVVGASIDCEDGERIFNSMKNTTHSTTNNKPVHVIGNLIFRQEVETPCKEKYEFDKSTDSTLNDIKQIDDELHQNESNSHFSYTFILESGSDWQSHLERISDILVFGENVWWEKMSLGLIFLLL